MNHVVYISSPKSQQIYVWQLNQFKEKLELMQIVCTPGNAQPIMVHPNHHFLYVGIRSNFGIVTYNLIKDGLLKLLKITKIFNSPTYLITNRNGTKLYCASYAYNTVNVISINEFGIPNYSIQTIQNLLGCHSINIDKNGLFWIPCLQEHSIRLFNSTDDGILSPSILNRIETGFGSGPRHMIFHNIHCYAYVINELNGTINVIKYGSENTIPVIVQTLSILPYDINTNVKKFWSSDIHITPNNQWVYCCDRFANTISCFKICFETNKLIFITYQHTEIQPRSFAIDTVGEFLIVAGEKSNHIALYRINTNTGKLSMISRYLSGINPIWVNIVPEIV